MQDTFGPEYVDGKLRDLVGGQAGSMLSFLASALTRVVGGGFALFNVVSLVVVTPVVGFYLLRDWRRAVARVDSWLPRRYAGVLRAQAREVDRILSAWVRGQALVLPGAGRVLRLHPVAGRARPRADRRHHLGPAVVHPLCRQRHRHASPASA